MARKFFIPKAGQTHARYAAFRLNSTLAYRGDVCWLDTLAPASQGPASDGVLAGETLGANDFIYAKTCVAVATTATTPLYHGLGFIEGLRIGDRDTTTLLPNDGVIIVQVAGVFKDHAAVTAAPAVGDVLKWNGNSTLGCALSATIITATLASQNAFIVGVALTTGATYVRAAVTNAAGCTAWVRCGDVV